MFENKENNMKFLKEVSKLSKEKAEEVLAGVIILGMLLDLGNFHNWGKKSKSN